MAATLASGAGQPARTIDLMASGVLLGIGVGGTGITALVGAVGRAASPEKRPQAIAALGMASGIGGFLAFPYVHLFMETLGWKGSLLVVIGTLAAIIPLAGLLAGKPQALAGNTFSAPLQQRVRLFQRQPRTW